MIVSPIQHYETKEWLLKKHYAKRMPSISYAFGLYIDHMLVGICTYGMPPSSTLAESISGKTYKNKVIELNRLIIPSMAKRKNGKIIHVGSIASNEAVGSLGYNIAKASLNAYVKTLGRDLASKNIVVTGIAPGGFITKDNAMDRLKIKNNKAYKKFIKERLPRKKMGNTNEIIPLVKFLCSENSGMMSGCLVPIDGGESKSYNF